MKPSAFYNFATECDLAAAIEAMFGGQAINETETARILHTALRDFQFAKLVLDGDNILPGHSVQGGTADAKLLRVKVQGPRLDGPYLQTVSAISRTSASAAATSVR